MLLHSCVRRRHIKGVVVVEHDDLRRVDKGEAEVGRHDLSVQVISAGRRVVSADLVDKVLFDPAEVIVQVQIQAEALDDLLETLADLGEDLAVLRLVTGRVIHLVKKVRDLRIIRTSLSRRARDHKSSALVRADDIADLFELLRAGEGAPAEFHYLDHNRFSFYLKYFTPLSKIFRSWRTGMFMATLSPIRSEWVILPRIRPSALVILSIAQ